MKRSHLLHPGTILGTVVLVAAVAGSVYGASTSSSATIGSAQIWSSAAPPASSVSYCVTPTAASGVTRATAMPIVTADFTDGSGTKHIAQFISTPISGCEGWVIVTDDFSGGSFARTDIAFSIVVP